MLDNFTKEEKQNIIIMAILAVMFIIGIIVRWAFVSSNIKESVMQYINIFTTTP